MRPTNAVENREYFSRQIGNYLLAFFCVLLYCFYGSTSIFGLYLKLIVLICTILLGVYTSGEVISDSNKFVNKHSRCISYGH